MHIKLYISFGGFFCSEYALVFIIFVSIIIKFIVIYLFILLSLLLDYSTSQVVILPTFFGKDFLGYSLISTHFFRLLTALLEYPI